MDIPKNITAARFALFLLSIHLGPQGSAQCFAGTHPLFRECKPRSHANTDSLISTCALSSLTIPTSHDDHQRDSFHFLDSISYAAYIESMETTAVMKSSPATSDELIHQQARSPSSSLLSITHQRSLLSPSPQRSGEDLRRVGARTPQQSSYTSAQGLAPPMKPRPAYNTRYSTEWTNNPVCGHCGSITPRSGATTVYGTPYMSKPSFMDLTIEEKVSLVQSRRDDC